MRRVQVYWVRFLYPGAFVAEESTRDLPCETRPEEIEWPKNAYAFELFKREDIIEGAESFRGKARKVGFTYYHPDSKVETLDEVKRNPGATPILAQNMKINGWTHILWARSGWAVPWDPETMRVLPKQ